MLFLYDFLDRYLPKNNIILAFVVIIAFGLGLYYLIMYSLGKI